MGRPKYTGQRTRCINADMEISPKIRAILTNTGVPFCEIVLIDVVYLNDLFAKLQRFDKMVLFACAVEVSMGNSPIRRKNKKRRSLNINSSGGGAYS